MHPERRSTPRRDCCYQVACSLENESSPFEATVRDMGLGGMRLILPRSLPPGTRMLVRQAGGGLGPVDVRVVWSGGAAGSAAREAGVVYQASPEALDASWVKPLLVRLGFESMPLRERRRHLRVNLSLGATLEVDGRAWPCKLLDLGLGGALLETLEAIPEVRSGTQARLAVKLDEEPLPSRVVYANSLGAGSEWRYGLCFDSDRATQALARLIEGYLMALG